MTKRLYFTCPIKALYMMKEFGVEFECQHENFDDKDDGFTEPYFDFRFLEIEQPETIGTLLDYIDNLGRIYVAAESESIFEPQEDDIGLLIKKWGKREEYYIVERKHWGNMNFKHNYKWFKGKEEVCTTEKVEITMRDNKQFFTPEVEND